jgi:restriction system protein
MTVKEMALPWRHGGASLSPGTPRMCSASRYPSPTLSPEEFELTVKSMLDTDGEGLTDYRSGHREVISGHDGDYEFDVTVRFTALGATYLTLIECKHYKSRVEREKVQALWAKIQSVGAHKGIMFASAGFQSGAVEFANSHGIALVEIADGRSSYLIKGGPFDGELVPWERTPDYISRIVGWKIDGNSISLVSKDRRLSLPHLPFATG